MAKTCWCSSSWVLPNSFFVATSEFHWRRRIQISSFKIVQRVDHHLDLDYGNDKQLLRHYYIFGLVFTLSREGWEQKSEKKEPKALPLSPSLCLSFVSLTVFYGKFTRTLRNDLTQQQPFYFFFEIELEIHWESTFHTAINCEKTGMWSGFFLRDVIKINKYD